MNYEYIISIEQGQGQDHNSMIFAADTLLFPLNFFLVLISYLDITISSGPKFESGAWLLNIQAIEIDVLLKCIWYPQILLQYKFDGIP